MLTEQQYIQNILNNLREADCKKSFDNEYKFENIYVHSGFLKNLLPMIN